MKDATFILKQRMRRQTQAPPDLISFDQNQDRFTKSVASQVVLRLDELLRRDQSFAAAAHRPVRGTRK
jgi:hypothetical protein